jgi:uncharacterized membrane protein YcaP (DUF421 family)
MSGLGDDGLYIHLGEIMETVFRTALSFSLLMVITYTLGKLINSKMTHSHFAVAITLGSVIANMSFDLNINFFSMLSSLITLVAIALVTSYVSLKNRRIRKWVAGKPVKLVEKGKILEGNLAKAFLTTEMLNQFLRENGIFDIEEVEYAFLENDGKLSALKKFPYRIPVNHQFGYISPDTFQMPIEIIVDGEILLSNLGRINNGEEWITGQLKDRGLKVKDVNYAVLNSKGKLFIDTYKDF